MTTMRARIISLMLVLTLCLSLIPAGVFALEEGVGMAQANAALSQAQEKAIRDDDGETVESKQLVRVYLKKKKGNAMKGDLYALPETLYYRWRWYDNTDRYYSLKADTPELAQLVWMDEYPYAKCVGTGKATFTYSLGDSSGNVKSCKFTLNIKAGKPTSVVASEETIQLSPGATHYLSATVYPETADERLRFKTSNKKVAKVDKSGIITAVKPGTATITVTSWDKKQKDTVTVVVAEGNPGTVRRGLSVGECSGTNGSYYNDNDRYGEDLATTANINAMASLFKQQGASAVTLKNPSSKAAFTQAVKQAFAGADSDDVNYLYIQAHGMVYNNMHYMAIAPYCYDISQMISAKELRSLLATIPGEKVVILESCYSGAAIGKGMDDDFAQGFIDDFNAGASAKLGEMVGSQYYVMCAASKNQESWFVWHFPSLTDSGKLTGGLFTYAVARGAGWNMVTGKACVAAANKNSDNIVTMAELEAYTASEVNRMQTILVHDQTVAFSPSGSSHPLFID